jgi:mRNA-degrading endonuclease RelE of RelBE toxin-antitoxin system
MEEVGFTPEALEQAGKLPLPIQARVRDIVERLRQWPNVSGAKPLRGELKGCYRIRTGAYRLIFRPTRHGIVIEAVGHRKDVYEG